MIGLGSKVRHNFPGMLNGKVGTIVADAGKKYQRQYWLVEWHNFNATCRCAFWEDVLYPANQKRKKVYDGTLSDWLA